MKTSQLDVIILSFTKWLKSVFAGFGSGSGSDEGLQGYYYIYHLCTCADTCDIQKTITSSDLSALTRN